MECDDLSVESDSFHLEVYVSNLGRLGRELDREGAAEEEGESGYEERCRLGEHGGIDPCGDVWSNLLGGEWEGCVESWLGWSEELVVSQFEDGRLGGSPHCDSHEYQPKDSTINYSITVFALPSFDNNRPLKAQEPAQTLQQD